MVGRGCDVVKWVVGINSGVIGIGVGGVIGHRWLCLIVGVSTCEDGALGLVRMGLWGC